MTTAAKFAHITNKKLLGFVDFDSYMLKYLRADTREAIKRLFVQGAFDEAMPLSSPGANQVRVDLKPTFEDGFAHDGAGHILNLEEITRTVTFANTAAQVYEVGAGYIEYPEEIRINPRTGKPEYDHFVEGIGVEAEADDMTVGGSTLTFVVDSLFESGVAVGVHTGRQVRVFLAAGPGDVGTTEAAAIETATVFYGGGMNQITTTGLLGQTIASSDTGDYVIQLVGLSVLKTEADNAPSSRPDDVFFIGTVTGNGGTPAVFNTSAQNVIQSQSAIAIEVAVLPDWAEGTANPADNLQDVLEKMIADLTTLSSITFDSIFRGDHGALAGFRKPAGSAIYFAAGAGKLVGLVSAVGAGQSKTSPDGHTWIDGSNLGLTVHGVKYVGTKFIFIGSAGNIFSSSDGLSWADGSTAGIGPDPFVSIAFGNALYLVSGLNTYFTSANGTAWTHRNPGAFTGYSRVEFGLGMWLAVKPGASTAYITSTDGLAWTARTFPGSITVSAVKYSSEFGFLVAARNGTTRMLLRSVDGINWTTVYSAVDGGASDYDSILVSNHFVYLVPLDSSVGTLTLVFRELVQLPTKSFITPGQVSATHQQHPELLTLGTNRNFFAAGGWLSPMFID